MEIPYEFGQTIWTLPSSICRSVYVLCKLCKGQRKLKLADSDKLADCPDCYPNSWAERQGTDKTMNLGYVYVYPNIASSMVIRDIHIYEDRILINGLQVPFFLSSDEVLKEIDRLNSEAEEKEERLIWEYNHG